VRLFRITERFAGSFCYTIIPRLLSTLAIQYTRHEFDVNRSVKW